MIFSPDPRGISFSLYFLMPKGSKNVVSAVEQSTTEKERKALISVLSDLDGSTTSVLAFLIIFVKYSNNDKADRSEYVTEKYISTTMVNYSFDGLKQGNRPLKNEEFGNVSMDSTSTFHK